MDTNTWINIVLIAVIALFLYFRLAPVKGLRTLKADAFQAEMEAADKPLLIDVREPAEFRSGHIPGARNIPLSQLQQRIHEIPKDRKLLLYCRSGMRSRTAAKILLKHQYKDLAHLGGGISAWRGKVTK